MEEAITKGNQKSQSQSRSRARARARDFLGKRGSQEPSHFFLCQRGSQELSQ